MIERLEEFGVEGYELGVAVVELLDGPGAVGGEGVEVVAEVV